MTTTITVETHSWPVAVTTSDEHNYSTPHERSQGWARRTEFVPPYSKQQFHITNTRSLTFEELPQDAKGLPDLGSIIGSAGMAGVYRVAEAAVNPGDEVVGDGA